MNRSRTSRRDLLCRGAAILATAGSVGASGCVSTLMLRKRQQQRGFAGGPPISFSSQRKRIRKTNADKIVKNPDALIRAIQQPKTTVWIPEDASIDMSGHSGTKIAPNVTIASNRNLGGEGGLITFNDYETAFIVPDGGGRLTGVRLQGPETNYRKFDTEKETYAHAASGIHFMGQTAIVDNCDIFGWPAFGVGIGSTERTTQGWVHHNDIHHCQMGSLGYPIELFNGFSLIEWNYFSHYRHVVAGYGQPTNGYEARFNVVSRPSPDVAAFAFDMHKLGEQDDYPSDNNTAGRWINVHHNVCEFTEESAMSISGIPTQYARFANNWCAHSKSQTPPAAYAPDGADLRVSENLYGMSAVEKGRQWLTQLTNNLSLSDGKPSNQAWNLPKNLTGDLNNTTHNATNQVKANDDD